MSITERIDRTVRIPDDQRTAILPPPHAVKIDLMRTCNYRCGFCSHTRLSEQKGAMEWGLYTRIIDELVALGVEEVAPFFFGESFLHPQLADAIAYAKRAGFKYVFLTTNGSVATPERVLECMAAGLDSLKFSFNYADDAQFSEVAGVSPRLYHQAIQNIKAAYTVRKLSGHRCGLYASYIQYDGEQAQRMAEALEEIRPYLDEVYALPLYSQAGTVTRDGWEFSGGNRGRADAPVDPVPCWALFREGHINFDGTLCACCFSVSDNFTMGDLKTQTFMEAWNSEKFKALRQAHLEGDIRGTPCEGCVVMRGTT